MKDRNRLFAAIFVFGGLPLLLIFVLFLGSILKTKEEGVLASLPIFPLSDEVILSSEKDNLSSRGERNKSRVSEKKEVSFVSEKKDSSPQKQYGKIAPNRFAGILGKKPEREEGYNVYTLDTKMPKKMSIYTRKNIDAFLDQHVVIVFAEGEENFQLLYVTPFASEKKEEAKKNMPESKRESSIFPHYFEGVRFLL